MPGQNAGAEPGEQIGLGLGVGGLQV